MSTLGSLLRMALVATSLASCSKPPPPRPPPPPPAPAVVVEAPPPPKCEALEEGCTAKPDTQARIPGAPLVFAPPPGWTFAQEESATVAQKGRAMLVVVTREVKNTKKPPRVEALGAVVDRLGATFKTKGKPRWPRKADRVLRIGSLEVSLFQLDGAKREGGKGPVLVFSATLPAGGPLLVGGGFVPEDDDSNADADILASIESMGRAREGSATTTP